MMILTIESGCDYMIHISSYTGMHLFPREMNFLPPNKSITKSATDALLMDSVAQLHVFCL